MTTVSGSTGRATISKSLFVLLSYIIYYIGVGSIRLFFFIPLFDLCSRTRPRNRDRSEFRYIYIMRALKRNVLLNTGYWSLKSFTLV
jgi:hypothetical protein